MGIPKLVIANALKTKTAAQARGPRCGEFVPSGPRERKRSHLGRDVGLFFKLGLSILIIFKKATAVSGARPQSRHF